MEAMIPSNGSVPLSDMPCKNLRVPAPVPPTFLSVTAKALIVRLVLSGWPGAPHQLPNFQLQAPAPHSLCYPGQRGQEVGRREHFFREEKEDCQTFLTYC